MLPVSSATTSCSCHRQIPIYGGLKSFSSCGKAFDCNNVNKAFGKLSSSSKKRPTACFYSNYVGKSGQCGSLDMINQSFYQSSQVMASYESHHLGPNIVFVESSSNSAGDDQLTGFVSKTIDNTNLQPNYTNPDFPISVSDVPIDSLSASDFSDVVAELNDSIADVINGGNNVLNKSLDSITSVLTGALTSANEAVDNVVNDITSFLNKTGESAGNKLIGASSGLKEGSGAAGFVFVDVLRRTVVTVEDFLAFGAKNIGYAYDSVKETLPQEYQDTLSLSEGRVIEVLTPIGTTFRQVYIALKGFEENVGLDPNDPLIPVVLVLGVSAILWGSYRVLSYSGFAGDLSPQSTLELLRGNESVVLIDIRPENLRDRDGIPDLRRSSRFRYANVTVPEVEGTVKKLLKGRRDIDDSLHAAVIRNLKIGEDRSKVLVMDADGARSKGVARSLRKLGIKRPYRVQGGFQSWVKEGCRVKELRPETTLTILNEEAEAILEEINPTPLKLIGFGVGALVAAYSLLEWEKTLQFIGIFGLGQTIYRRVASYQDADDFKQDLRLLLAPVSLGGQAISWATEKLETSRNVLPTSPSSLDVQSRVLQAAAKLESQPPDSKETQDLPQAAAASGNEEINVSEA